MAHPQRSGSLQTIFSFFLGLMVTAFVGVGVYTFHPPDTAIEREIRELDRREQAIMGPSRAGDEITPAEREEVREIGEARAELADASRDAGEGWGRSTSMILIIFATLVMAISLVRADQLPVISNGLLMGGLFTMVYGVGWIVATDTSVARFVVLTFALVITLALGYARFVRPRGSSAMVTGEGVAGGVGGEELEARLRALEDRMEAAASALGRRSE